jgi:hypothetical protein
MSRLYIQEDWYRIGGQLLRPASDAVVVPPPTDTTPTELPTGPDYIRYEDLYRAGDTLHGAFARLTTPKIVTMPPGLFETKVAWGKAPYYDGAATPQYPSAFRPPKVCRGIIGSGRGGAVGSNDPNQTTIRVTPMTCMSASEGGSWFQVGGSGSGDWTMKNLRIEGTEQGMQTTDENRPGIEGPTTHKLFTNYFQSNQDGPVLIENVFTSGWYGNNGAPPGETFGIQVYQCDGHILRNVETDGRRAIGGPSYGAVGITAGNSHNAEWHNCWSHHANAKTYHQVFFQTAGCKTYDCRLGDSSDLDGTGEYNGYNGGGFNQERAMLSEHYRMDIYSNRKLGDKGVHFNHSSDAYSRTFDDGTTFSIPTHMSTKIIDSTWFNHWGKAGNPMYISTWIPYGGNANAITLSPDVINNGVHQVIMWSAGTNPIARQSPYQL